MIPSGPDDLGPRTKPGICPACGMAILCAETVHGLWIPIDPDQDVRGNHFFNDQGYLMVVPPGVQIDKSMIGTGYRSHFASCPRRKTTVKKL